MARNVPYHRGISPEQVIDAAVELTQESHLMSCSIRDLAKLLDTSQSVVYHHVGGKDAMCRGVVDRVVTGISMPEESLTWQDWFREFLSSFERRMSQYPGTMSWAVLHGPVLPSMLPFVETGVQKLRAAGFRNSALTVYSVLLNSMALVVSLTDERRRHNSDGAVGHRAMLDEFEKMSSVSSVIGEFRSAFIEPLAGEAESQARVHAFYRRFVIETTIAGCEAQLASGTID